MCFTSSRSREQRAADSSSESSFTWSSATSAAPQWLSALKVKKNREVLTRSCPVCTSSLLRCQCAGKKKLTDHFSLITFNELIVNLECFKILCRGLFLKQHTGKYLHGDKDLTRCTASSMKNDLSFLNQFAQSDKFTTLLFVCCFSEPPGN